MTNDKIAKLPKWARDHILSLERKLAEATSIIRDDRDSETASPFWHESYINIGDRGERDRKYLQVTDVTCQGQGVWVKMQPDSRGVYLSFRSESHDIAYIESVASNCIRIVRNKGRD